MTIRIHSGRRGRRKWRERGRGGIGEGEVGEGRGREFLLEADTWADTTMSKPSWQKEQWGTERKGELREQQAHWQDEAAGKPPADETRKLIKGKITGPGMRVIRDLDTLGHWFWTRTHVALLYTFKSYRCLSQTPRPSNTDWPLVRSTLFFF